MEPASLPRKFGIGAVVAVKKGVRDPDFDLPIGGWQGTVESFDTGDDGSWLYCVAWDSITLLKMRRKVFDLCNGIPVGGLNSKLGNLALGDNTVRILPCSGILHAIIQWC